MAKNSMKLKYKSPKREKNKNNVVETSITKNVIKTTVGVLVFLGIIYLSMLGLEKLGLFEAGYRKPVSDETVISDEFISIGTVFNRSEKTYYVLFDNFKSEYTSSTYVEKLLDTQEDYRVYKVDMSRDGNDKYASNEENTTAKTASDLKINGVTLIKISKGKIIKYISGADNIEEYLNK